MREPMMARPMTQPIGRPMTRPMMMRPTMTRAAAMLAACVLATAHDVAAQRAPRAADRACARIDTTAEWYRAQRQAADDSKHDWTNDSLRTELLALVPEAATWTPQLGWQTLDATHAATATKDSARLASLTTMLTAMAKKREWPTRSAVGAAGVHALVVMAERDTTLANMALHRMMEAGPDESSPVDVAMLEDRTRVRAGRKQLYGTVLKPAASGAKPESAPMEDAEHVDLRRDAAGMPPLKVALCAARSAMR